MTHSVFIAGTDTGVGKTQVTVALLRALAQAHVRASGMKPIATGVPANLEITADISIFEDDGRMIADASADGLTRQTLALVNPYRLPWAVSPHIAAAQAGVRIELDRIAAAYAQLAATHAVVVVEGTGGWLAPLDRQATMADLARRLAAPIVLVVGLRLGCLNHALLAARAITQDGLRLAGWVANRVDPGMSAVDENVATLTQRLQAPLLATLPHVDAAHGARAHIEPLRAFAASLAAGTL